MLSYEDIVSIVSIVIYFFCSFLSIFLIFRHGLTRSQGWILLALFSAIRISGAAIELSLAHGSHSSQQTNGLWIAQSILSSVGLAPILVALIFFLRRINDVCALSMPVSPQFDRALMTTQIPIYVGLVLSIVGASDASESIKTTHTYDANSTAQAGIIVLLLCWLTVVGVAVFIVIRVKSYDRAEHKPPTRIERLLPVSEELLLAAVCVSLTLLGVRLLYQILAILSSNKDFDLVSGNETIKLCMEDIEEYVITIALIGAGLGLKVLKNLHPRQERRGAAKYLAYVPFVHWFIK